MDMMTNVEFDTLKTKTGHLLGMITLNDPKALNSVSLAMCQAIDQQLDEWQQDERLVAVFLQGAGEKAFCAGGNIRKLYDDMITKPVHESSDPIVIENPSYFTQFFVNEYRLNHKMATYPKPIVAWVNGIAMGGGLGLVATCSHRIVTETTRFAMPEINIGLFPDATGSWFLSKMPAQVGLFFGLTGANGNASDALLCNLAEFAMPSAKRQTAIDALVDADWQDARSHHATVSKALSRHHDTTVLPVSNVINHWQTIQTIVNQGDIYAIDSYLNHDDFYQYAQQKASEGDHWLLTALQTYQYGCPVTACLAYTLFHDVKTKSLAEILQLELNVAIHCCAFADFREGVRALLVDKDKMPKWCRALVDCDADYINRHFDEIVVAGQRLDLIV